MNVIVINGRFTAAPEIRKTPSGGDLTRFRIAHNEGYGDTQKSMFINITAFGKTAQRVAMYGKKGNRVEVKGRLDISYYTKDGEEKEAVSIIAESVDLIDFEKQDTKPVATPESRPLERPETKGKPEYEDLYVSDEELPF